MESRAAILADIRRLRGELAETARDATRLGPTESAYRLNQLTAIESGLDEIVADLSALDDRPRSSLLARLLRRIRPTADSFVEHERRR